MIVTVEWKKHRMYGMCPYAYVGNKLIAKSIGCGYVKLSEVLHQVALHYNENYHQDKFEYRIDGKSTGGIIDNEIYYLEHISESKRTDVFKLEFK